MTSNRKSEFRSSNLRIWHLVLAALLMPWAMAASCVPGSGTLLDQQLTADFVPAAGDTGFCPSAGSVVQTTFLADALKTVTITVTGPTSLSRPEIRVIDAQSVVANSGVTPTTQTTVTTFAPSARVSGLESKLAAEGSGKVSTAAPLSRIVTVTGSSTSPVATTSATFVTRPSAGAVRTSPGTTVSMVNVTSAGSDWVPLTSATVATTV